MIAVLGATGYVGRSLARRLAERSERPLVLFARSPERLQAEPWPSHVATAPIDSFSAQGFGLVVNAVGAGDPAQVAALGARLLELTAFWDGRVLETSGPTTRYVFLSSGAIYGDGLERPARPEDQLCLPVNRLSDAPPYTLAKLYAEARHRQAPERAILDLRVFGYADPAIPADSRFFLADLIRALRSGAPFETDPVDMTRDYAGSAELAALITAWESAGAPNTAADLYTLAPLTKAALLEQLEARYGLVVIPRDGPGGARPRRVYASENRAAAALGYRPDRSAMDVVLATVEAALRD